MAADAGAAAASAEGVDQGEKLVRDESTWLGSCTYATSYCQQREVGTARGLRLGLALRVPTYLSGGPRAGAGNATAAAAASHGGRPPIHPRPRFPGARHAQVPGAREPGVQRLDAVSG